MKNTAEHVLNVVVCNGLARIVGQELRPSLTSANVKSLPKNFGRALRRDGTYTITRVKSGGISLVVVNTVEDEGIFPGYWYGTFYCVCNEFLNGVGIFPNKYKRGAKIRFRVRVKRTGGL